MKFVMKYQELVSQLDSSLQIQRVKFGIYSDFYSGQSFHVLPINTFIKVNTRSTITAIWICHRQNNSHSYMRTHIQGFCS